MDQTNKYLEDLKSENPAIRNNATQELWSLWYRQAGPEMERELNLGAELMNSKKFDQALFLFKNLIKKCPEFSEAHNKLATLFFLMDRYEDSVKECEEVLERVPHHFGALNGMGICLFQLGRFEEAVKSFQKALEIQPYAEINRIHIAHCRGRLN